MPHAAPTELSWRPFRNEGDDVCDLGTPQQQEGTLACRPVWRPRQRLLWALHRVVPRTRRRQIAGSLRQGEAFDVPNRPFRNVALLGDQLPYSAGPKSLLQPVDQPGKLLRRRIVCGNGKLVLLFGHVLGAQDMEGRCFEAEVRFELGVKAIEAQTDQLGQMLCVTTWCGKSQIQRYRRAIQLEQQQSQQAHANRIAGKILHQPLKQAPSRLEHVLLLQNRLEELHLRAVAGRRHNGNERLGCTAQGLIESRQKWGIEAGTERGARLID